MTTLKKRTASLLMQLSCCILIALTACNNSNPPENLLSVHPRILMPAGEEQAIQMSLETNPVLERIHEAILDESDRMIQMEVLERTMQGRRLLGTSREVLRRIFYLSYAYRMTGREDYFVRAEQEMLASAAFSDWNPAHFLDVAEMTMALAIGYDWLYNRLSDESRAAIRDAILKKGIEPSFDEDYNWFLDVHHNWNQVCNAGIAFGALAIYEDHHEISMEVINRAFQSISLPMKDYEPDGAYPEGYGYWSYGTSFNVMFLSAVDRIWPGRFNYEAHTAFMKTGSFTKNMLTPTGNSFNWGDNGPGGAFSPAMYWFADKNGQPSLLWQENKLLGAGNDTDLARERLLPAIMIWGREISAAKIDEPAYKVYVGHGAMPVAAMRTSWSDQQAIYLGFKGGSPSVNHGHMDVGSFVMEADGERWASDLGPQNYNSLELLGMGIWDRSQESDRWKVLRLNNYIHNTLTVNGTLQQVDGNAGINRHGERPDFLFAVSDISMVYETQLKSAVRGAGIVNQEFVVIRDELQASDTKAVVRWQILTEADVHLNGDNTATLVKNGKSLLMRIDEPAGARMITWSSQPANEYDVENPGTILVGFEVVLDPQASKTLQVSMIPSSAGSDKHFSKALADW